MSPETSASHDMGHMGDMDQMNNHAMALLPTWLGVVLGIMSLLVIVPHITHVLATTGQHRWWHIAHIVMAIGMAQMFLFGMANPFINGTFAGLFVAITCLLLATTAWSRAREGTVNPLWIATAVDIAAMAYMYAPASARPGPVTWLLIVYLVAQAVAWASGAWGKVPTFALEASPSAAGSGDDPGWRIDADRTACPEGSGPIGVAVAPRPRLGLSGRKDPGVRATLAFMALAMAYMLLAMV